jgi:hypothetical protein
MAHALRPGGDLRSDLDPAPKALLEAEAFEAPGCVLSRIGASRDEDVADLLVLSPLAERSPQRVAELACLSEEAGAKLRPAERVAFAALRRSAHLLLRLQAELLYSSPHVPDRLPMRERPAWAHFLAHLGPRAALRVAARSAVRPATTFSRGPWGSCPWDGGSPSEPAADHAAVQQAALEAGRALALTNAKALEREPPGFLEAVARLRDAGLRSPEVALVSPAFSLDLISPAFSPDLVGRQVWTTTPSIILGFLCHEGRHEGVRVRVGEREVAWEPPMTLAPGELALLETPLPVSETYVTRVDAPRCGRVSAVCVLVAGRARAAFRDAVRGLERRLGLLP